MNQKLPKKPKQLASLNANATNISQNQTLDLDNLSIDLPQIGRPAIDGDGSDTTHKRGDRHRPNDVISPKKEKKSKKPKTEKKDD